MSTAQTVPMGVSLEAVAEMFKTCMIPLPEAPAEFDHLRMCINELLVEAIPEVQSTRAPSNEGGPFYLATYSDYCAAETGEAEKHTG